MDSPHATTPNTIGSVPSQMNAWVAYHQKRRNETRDPSIWIRLGLESDIPANDDPAKYWDAGSRPVAIFPEEESGYGKPSLTRGGSVGAFATERLSDDSVELKIKNGVGLFTGHTMKKGISGATFRANKKMCRVGKAGWMEMEGHVEVCQLSLSDSRGVDY
jgi:hypothetical protein